MHTPCNGQPNNVSIDHLQVPSIRSQVKRKMAGKAMENSRSQKQSTQFVDLLLHSCQKSHFSHSCSLVITKIQEEDFGKWECDITLKNGKKFRKISEIQRSLEVEKRKQEFLPENLKHSTDVRGEDFVRQSFHRSNKTSDHSEGDDSESSEEYDNEFLNIEEMPGTGPGGYNNKLNGIH